MSFGAARAVGGPPHDLEGLAKFAEIVKAMEALLGQLWAAPAAPRKKHLPIPKTPGVYLFTEDGKPMYVGQSRNLRKRLGWHTRPKSRQNQATFAFALAKRAAEAAGVLPDGTRDDVADHEKFRPFFAEAKAKVALMDVRFIELSDPHHRTVFEVYAALALGTGEFNSFETH